MQKSIVNHLFEILDKTALIIQTNHHTTYLEALCSSGENIFKDQIDQQDLKEELAPLYAKFFQEGMTAEDIRRAFQLAVLKGMKSAEERDHQITPDSLVIFMGHLASKLMRGRSFSILDPAVGTGNLLTGILNQAEENDGCAFGVDVDSVLIKLAYTNANLQQKDIRLFHQDSLRPLFVDPVDIVACDVPVGIYPDKETAAPFALNSISGQAYSHFLFIEQGLKYAKQAGYLLYLVPNQLFSQDSDHTFYRFVQKSAVVLGLLQLPSSLFKNQSVAKSILILQKKGQGVKIPKQALLAELPSFAKKRELSNIMMKIDDWFEHHLS